MGHKRKFTTAAGLEVGGGEGGGEISIEAEMMVGRELLINRGRAKKRQGGGSFGGGRTGMGIGFSSQLLDEK